MNMDPTNQLDNLIIPPGMPLGEALARLDKSGTGALVLCDADRRMIGLLSDGDIRRALLRGTPLDTPSEAVANRTPLLARKDLPRRDALQLMILQDFDHLPVVDESGVLQELLLRRTLVAEDSLRNRVGGRLDSVVIRPHHSIADAIAQLNRAGTGALVVCSEGRRLEGLLSDGDIRRAFLRGASLEEPCGGIAKSHPFTVRYPLSETEAIRLMLERDINQLPVLDDEGNLLDFILRRELINEGPPNLSAVIMAGGFGKRLLPLTEQLPKPMLPVGDKPLLERTIDRLRLAGVRDVHLTTHYLPEHIEQHFGDGERFGVHVNYAQENHPMGTAGGLRLLPRPSQSFVVINGDILTGVSFEEMLHYHQQNLALLTVGVRKYEVKVPFGVVEHDGVRISSLKEKPSLTFFVNAGVYLLEPSAYDLIPEAERFDMTDLIQQLLDLGQPVVCFPIMEYWLDVGRPDDYQRAQEDALTGKI